MERQHSPCGAPKAVITDQISQGCSFSSPRVARSLGDFFRQLSRKCRQTTKTVRKQLKRYLSASCSGRACASHLPKDRVVLISGSLFTIDFVFSNGKLELSIMYITIPICQTVVGSGS